MEHRRIAEARVQRRYAGSGGRVSHRKYRVEAGSKRETVVAVLPGEEATLKRFYLEEDGVRLQPANSTMEPIFAPSVEIRGVVVSVIRQI